MKKHSNVIFFNGEKMQIGSNMCGNITMQCSHVIPPPRTVSLQDL